MLPAEIPYRNLLQCVLLRGWSSGREITPPPRLFQSCEATQPVLLAACGGRELLGRAAVGFALVGRCEKVSEDAIPTLALGRENQHTFVMQQGG